MFLKSLQTTLVVLILLIILLPVLGMENVLAEENNLVPGVGIPEIVGEIREIVEVIHTIFSRVGFALVLGVLTLGGVVWLTSFGSPQRIASAKQYIKSSLIGLCILVGAELALSLLGIPTATGKILRAGLERIRPDPPPEEIVIEWDCQEIDIQAKIDQFLVLKTRALKISNQINERIYGSVNHQKYFGIDKNEVVHQPVLGLIPAAEKVVEIINTADNKKTKPALTKNPPTSLQCPAFCPADQPIFDPGLEAAIKNLRTQIIEIEKPEDEPEDEKPEKIILKPGLELVLELEQIMKEINRVRIDFNKALEKIRTDQAAAERDPHKLLLVCAEAMARRGTGITSCPKLNFFSCKRKQ